MRIFSSGLCLLSLFSAMSLAQEAPGSQAAELHDADPRNTQTTLGFGADQDGDIKLVAGTGGGNLYGNGEYQTQTIFYTEYYTQAEQARIRLANFDERFGGIYADVAVQDVMDLYSVGYMLPLETVESKLLFFPSINYMRASFNTDEAADNIVDANGGPIEIDGIEYDAAAISDIIHNLALEGNDEADLVTLNLYAMMPWNNTHFSMLQLVSGSSYGGFDMETNLVYFQHGLRAKLGENIVNIYLEAQHSKTNIQGVDTEGDRIGLGINFKI